MDIDKPYRAPALKLKLVEVYCDQFKYTLD